jgi:hypothetical protein
VLLLIFASLGVFVVDNEVDLVGGTTLVGAEHDDIGRGVGELLLVEGLVITEELQISTTTLETACRLLGCVNFGLSSAEALTLKLDFILDNKGLALILNLLWEFGRDSMMSSCVLDNQALVAFHAFEDMRFFDSPLSNICPFLVLVRALGILLGVRWLPSCLPVVCELLDEVGLQLCGLQKG